MSLELEVLSNTRKAQQDLSKLDLAVGNIQKSVEKNNVAFQGLAKSAQTSLNGLDNTVKSVVSSLQTMAITIGMLGGAIASAMSLARVTDQFINMRSQLELATRSQNEFNAAFRDTSYIAVNTRQDLASVASLYAKISSAAQSFGGTQQQVAVFTQAVSKSIAASGASAQASSAAIEQLGQALASGSFQGDELRSILENAPALAKTIADGLGKSIGELRALGAAGKLTARDIFNAVLKESGNVDARFKRMGVTYSSAFTNLGNSFNLLFDAISRSFGSSTGTFADKLNGIAVSVANIAFNFDHLVLQAKTKLLLFAADVVNVFDSLTARLGKAASFSTDFNIGVTQINIKDFIPNLKEMRDLVGKWVYDVERMFFWLYDEVIGHSWIPDLVEGIIKWTSKLVQAPLGFVTTFVNSAIGLFAKLFKFASSPIVLTFGGLGALAAWTASGGTDGLSNMVNKVANVFKTFITTVKDVGARLWEIVKELYDKVKQKLSGDTPNRMAFQKYLPESVNKKIELARTTIADLKEVFDKSTFGHNFKQLLGIKDNIKDLVPGTNFQYDTNAYVGRGPQRSSKDRTFGHDFFNALPDKYQLPVFTGLSAAIMGAIVLAMDASPVRSVVLGLFTTAAGVFAANVFYDKNINEFTGSVTDGVLSGLKKGINFLFGEGIFTNKDPFSLLVLIAKLSLLFEAGRKYMLSMAGAVAMAPTNMALRTVDRGALAIGQLQQSRLAKALQTLPATVNANVANANSAMRSSTAALANSLNGNNTRVGPAIAAAFANRGAPISSLNQFSGAARRAAIEVSRNAQVQRLANNALSQLPSQISALTTRHTAISEANKSLSSKITEQTTAAKQNLVGFGGNAGGVLGSVYGFNIGRKMAEGMDGYSDWTKIGVTVGAALAGQFVFAVVGSTLVSTLLNPFVIGAAIIGVTLFSIFKKFSSFSEFGDSIGRAIEIGIAKFIDATPKWVEMLRDWTPEWVKRLLPDAVVTPKVNAPQGPRQPYVRPDLSASLNAAGNLAATPFNNTFSSAVDQTLEVHKIQDTIKVMDQLISDANSKMLAIPRSDTEGKDLAKDIISNMQDQKFILVKKLEDAGGQPMSVLRGAEQVEYKNRTPGYIPPVVGPGAMEPFNDWQYKFGVVLDKAAEDISAKSVKALDSIKTFFIDLSAMRAGVDVPIKRANGGSVWGAGTATSDSIPAMLSNGEFVVNARDAAKHRGLLESINSGSIPKFADGGAVEKWKEYARNAANKAGLNPDFVVNLITVESNWNPSAVSPAKAAGLGQMIPSTAEQFEIPYTDLFDPLKSIDATIKYLTKSMERFGNDQLKLAIAYNAGEGRLAGNMAKNGGAVNISTLPEETIQYTAKLKAAGSDLAGGISSIGTEFKGTYKELNQKALELRKAGGDAFVVAKSRTDAVLAKVADSASNVATGFMSLFDNLSGDFSKDFVTVYDRAKKMALDSMKSPDKPKMAEDVPSFTKQFADTPDMLGNYTLLGGAFEKFKIDFGLLDSFFTTAPAIQEQIIQEIDSMYRLQDAMAKTANPVLKKGLATQIDDIAENINKSLKRASEKDVFTGKVKSAEGAAAGAQVAQVFQKSVTDNFRSVILGNQKWHKGLRGVLFSFSEQVFNTVTDSFVQGFTKQLSTLISGSISGIFDGGFSIGDWLSKLMSPPKTVALGSVEAPVVSDSGASIFSSMLGYFGVNSKAPTNTLPFEKAAKTSDPEQIGVLQSGFDSMVSSFRESFPRMAEMINSGLGETFLKGIGGLLGSLDGVFRSIFSVFNTMGTGGGGGVNWLGIGLQVAGMVGGMMSPAPAAAGAATAGSGANLATMGGGQGLMLSSGSIGAATSSSLTSTDWLRNIKFSGTYAIGGVIPGPLGSPQPIMGHGGELVLNSQQQRALLNGENGGNTQHITLNIQGDVSRQTRSEVMRLIPQIALGVNAQNKEAGSR